MNKLTILSGLALFGSVSLSIFFGEENSAQAQQVAKMRFTWDVFPSSGALYLNICDNPDLNVNEQTGGCADINVLNSNITTNKSRTRLVTDRLKSGQSYKVCMVADNTFSNRQGRWITCTNFVAQDGLTISLSMRNAQYVGAP
ncbi:MAG: hypothetical protein GC158_15875 [Cyanobacteria bacterium RI_101]|nr:hypothetical protein [Cyanobacteria bacterium RI_101]